MTGSRNLARVGVETPDELFCEDGDKYELQRQDGEANLMVHWKCPYWMVASEDLSRSKTKRIDHFHTGRKQHHHHRQHEPDSLRERRFGRSGDNPSARHTESLSIFHSDIRESLSRMPSTSSRPSTFLTSGNVIISSAGRSARPRVSRASISRFTAVPVTSRLSIGQTTIL
jgi:hypothetical protein